ncbi:MAG: hypothetical protein U0230_24155 [Polyangiales bacterium]
MSRVESVLQRLRAAGGLVSGTKSLHPLRDAVFGPGCCAGELTEFASWWRGGLPGDYEELLSLCRSVSAPDVHNGYFIYSPLAVARQDASIPRRLHVVIGEALEEVGVTAFAGDGAGNQFLLGMGGVGRGMVWKWSHERPVRFDGVATEGLTLEASSFVEFLERIAEDWEHFVRGDHDWVYLSG